MLPLAVTLSLACGTPQSGAAGGSEPADAASTAGDKVSAPSLTPATSAGDGAATGSNEGVDARGPTTHDRDIVSVDLTLDDAASTAVAELRLAAGDADPRFEIGDLTIDSVALVDEGGTQPLKWATEDGLSILQVRLPASTQAQTVRVSYHYLHHDKLEGASNRACTMLWPYYCGQLFPCDSRPRDGITFRIQVNNLPEGQRAVVPPTTEFEAPAYMLAYAIGNYEETELGATKGGTTLVVFHRDDDERKRVLAGAQGLVGAFDWLESTYGPYPYGKRAGTVPVTWGMGAYGGMEHHPYWHVATDEVDGLEVHVHEAAHGWFGNGVRVACWEDLVLSEGVTSYVSARAIEAALGDKAAAKVWEDFERRLKRTDGELAWPEGCDEHDVLRDRIFSGAVYMRGAMYFRALERRVGRAQLDAAMRSFMDAHRGGAARLEDLLAAIHDKTGYDPRPCAMSWLRERALPDKALMTCPKAP